MMDDGDYFPTSVAEFLASPAFTNGVLLLEDEDAASQQPSSVGEDGGEEERRRQRRVVENAARVALVLARTFANMCRGSDISHDAAHHQLSHIELDDFSVRLDRDGPGRSRVQPSAPKEESDDLMDCFRQLVDDEEERQRAEVKDVHGNALGLGYFSSNNDALSGNEKRVDDPPMDAKLRSSTNTDQTANESQSCDESAPTQVLYGMDVTFPTRMKDDQPQSAATPLQILGKLLYGVFCLGESPPPEISISTAMKAAPEPLDVSSLDLEDAFSLLSSRTSRGAEATLFSQLVDSESFPIAVCRLISDLIDAGSNVGAPFRSFDSVIEELEQMTSQPRMCLHDSYTSHVTPRPPIFGQVYYGRDEEVATIVAAAERTKNCAPEENVGVEAVFVHGIAGSGKSQLVQTASDQLSRSGWTLVKGKFERGAEHASRGIVSSIFDDVVSLLAKMKDEDNGKRASKSILDYVGLDLLPSLADFLPSLPELFGRIYRSGSKQTLEDWQLVNCVSKIIEAAIGAGQQIILCCDDMQWADRTALALIMEVLTRLGETFCRTDHCVFFVGLYRDDEVDDDHNLSIQYSYLQLSSNIRTSEVALASLTKEDVANMLMTELRLPRRMVWELADTVYKKTSGHAFFVAELLNSLLRDSTIAYSPKLRRFGWDEDIVAMKKTGDNVAGLIASNISTLSEEHRHIIRILACFGIQTDIPLLKTMEDFQRGIIPSLDIFIERGILDRAGPLLMFCHDLIQQAAYEAVPLADRQQLHLAIGQFLGDLASVDARSSVDPLAKSMGQLSVSDQIFFAGSNLTSSLVGIACDQIDSVPTEAIGSDCDLLQFAEWNLAAGQKAAAHSDYRAAQYYFAKGIDFLGNECWLNDYQLCLALHEGAVFASFSLGEAERAVEYAERVIEFVSFEETLDVQQYLLRSLTQLGKPNECVARGTDLLRKLKFDIPLTLPTREIVTKAMAITDLEYSKYKRDDFLDLCEKTIDGSARSIVRIMEAFYLACYASASPILPLVTCELVRYSLNNGICQEAPIAFASYGMFKIAVQDDYASAREIAETTRALVDKLQAANRNRQNFDIRSRLLLFITIDIWFSSPRVVSRQLLNYHQRAKQTRQMDIAMIALQMGWRYLLYGGEKLSFILQGAEERTELIAKNCGYASKYIILDNAVIEELTGRSIARFDDIDGFSNSVDDIQADAEAVNNNRLLHHIHFNSMLLAYWRGDFATAEKSSRAAWKFPTAKMPHILLIYHTFFAGLIAFRLLRSSSGGDDERMKEGKEMTDQMGVWTQNAKDVFGNKWHLLQAEHAACDSCLYFEAMKQYKASIEVARDHGNVHELALAHELVGEYLASCGRQSDATAHFKQAHAFYNQWGATAVAERLLSRHNLVIDSAEAEQQSKASKRIRPGDVIDIE